MFKSLKKILIFFCLLIAAMTLAHFVLALDVGMEYGEATGLGQEDPRIIVAKIIRIILGFLGIIAVGLIIYAGWLYMTASGEAEKIEKAKKILTGAVIGLIICLMSFAIASFILNKLLGATGEGNGGGNPVCDPPCDDNQFCCNGSCQNSSCGIGGGGGGVETPCDANILEAGCQADSSFCEAGRYCDSNSCTCKTIVLPGEGETCLTDVLDITCAAGSCDTGLTCDSSDCKCKTTNNPGEGQNCDSDTTLDGCQASDCSNNLICSANNNCTCIRTPLIAWISPTDASGTPNGAPGNFITIGGQYFGTTTGSVVFLGDVSTSTDDKVATFPNLVNSHCTDFWQDSEIIAVIPTNATSGPIKVIASSTNLWDTTDNTRGPSINDFQINNIKRPGLCLADPNIGGFGDSFTLQGASFDGTDKKVLFGNEISNISADAVRDWTATSTNAKVPNIQDSRNSIFVSSAGITSNSLNFIIKNNIQDNPIIARLDPSEGPVGQYVTVYGSNFKNFDSGKSMVQFYLLNDPNTKINADVDFPVQCSNKYWNNTSIIIKVPRAIPLAAVGDYKIIVINKDGKISNPADFKITTGAPSPGICLLDPYNGPVGQSVQAYGDYFGSSQGTNGRVVFYNNIDSSPSSWTNQLIKTNVPNGAQTGPFKIINNNQKISNTIAFKVGACSSINDCLDSNTEECCPSGTYNAGICKTIGECSLGGEKNCVFSWTFSTMSGLITPLTCGGYSSASACSAVGACPNALGECQSRTNIETGDCSDDKCNQTVGCDNKCVYVQALNKCKLTDFSCNTATTTLVAGFTAECNKVGNKNIWQINTKGASCPFGTYLEINNWCSVGDLGSPIECSLCSSNFICQEGTCIIPSSGCSNGSFCDSGSDKCIKGYDGNKDSVCECCCRVANSAQDCCAGLTCSAGGCGLGAPDYGVCTGCKVIINGSVNELLSNQSCNCSGNSTRYCDLTDQANYPLGVCKDQLIAGEFCYSNANVDTCDIARSTCAAGRSCNVTTCKCETSPVNPIESCSGYGLGQCNNSYFCPNSPGKCSTYSGGRNIETGLCDYTCNNFDACKTDLCEYNLTINKCAKKNQTCNLPKLVNYTVGNITATSTADCFVYNTQNRWIMLVKTSCPIGWTNIGDNKCVEDNTTCLVCDTSFKCAKDTNSVIGVCAIDKSVCQTGSICKSNNKCIKVDSPSCECCCRIGYDKEDCCAPLKCEGRCGSDIGTTTPATFGSCSGCANVGTTQLEHNVACNCSGSTNRFCLINTANPEGVCKDCSQITNSEDCSILGINTCCVDAQNQNACRGGAGNKDIISNDNPDYAYCSYNTCNELSGTCNSVVVASSTLPSYRTLAICTANCINSSASVFGQNCDNKYVSPPTCDNNICAGFSCLNAEGNSPASPSSSSSCGICCCKPNAITDQCRAINNNLSCLKNKGNCSGDNRGLCCGCSQDDECSDGVNGCGNDTCCYARPEVVDPITPSSNQLNVCRNTVIEAKFDQAMDIGSFSNNMFLIGDYKVDQCPAGTKFLGENISKNNNIFTRIIKKALISLEKILKPIFGKNILAIGSNYCLISGTVSGRNEINEINNQSTITFTPQKALDKNKTYYVVIKGDASSTDSVKEGVLSEAGVSMIGDDNETFNAKTFTNSKIWSFTTGDNICSLANVIIDPASYLFQTDENDPSDDNTETSVYDTIRDNDKVFSANALAIDGQEISPLTGVYSWEWQWSIDDSEVADFRNLNNTSRQTVVAKNKQDAKTIVNAKAVITDDTVTNSVGQSKVGKANVYVFKCANPWPPVGNTNIWWPWQDMLNNCSAGLGGSSESSCFNNNFEFYYCRDAGQIGTSDDLPAILKDTTVRGYYGAPNPLKEYYFFREDIPSITALSVSDQKTGGKVVATWASVPNASGYKLYYGKSFGKYDNFVDVKDQLSRIITGLTNNQIYYFAVSAYYKTTGAESSYSNEQSVIPTDTTAPTAPTNLVATAGDGKVVLTWSKSTDDTAYFQAFYGTASRAYGNSARVDLANCVTTETGIKCSAIFENLVNNTVYYFAIKAIDSYSNSSDYSNEATTTPQTET